MTGVYDCGWQRFLIAAASGLMAAVAVTATTGVNHTPAHVYLAGHHLQRP